MSERNDETKELLISNVKRYRKAQHLTQEKLAEMSGLNSIADIEGGRSNPNLSTIVKLANSLKVSGSMAIVLQRRKVRFEGVVI